MKAASETADAARLADAPASAALAADCAAYAARAAEIFLLNGSGVIDASARAASYGSRAGKNVYSKQAGRKEFWSALANDQAIVGREGQSRALLNIPVWHSSRSLVFEEAGEMFLTWLRADSATCFWADWYEAALAGRPMPWAMQKEITLIENRFWLKGAAAVAVQIDRIQRKYELKAALKSIEHPEQLVAVDRHGIGGNNPPIEIEDEATALRAVEIVWVDIGVLKEEVEREDPDTSRVRRAIASLQAALAAVLTWCGKKLDRMVDKAVDTMVPAALAYIVANSEGLKAITKLAEAWLRAL